MNDAPVLVLRSGQIYDPAPRGVCDLVLAGGKIIHIGNASLIMERLPHDIPVWEMDCRGKMITPGLVDLHVHITGGGGEQGPASRCPEANVDELVKAGVTTLIGVLGTDSISRSLENLLFKAQALTHQGLTCFMYTGAYNFPLPTLTGSVGRDISLIEKCIGVGEIAVSDHRGTAFCTQDLARIASEARVAGLVSGKKGLVHCHMGNYKTGLAPLIEIVDHTAIPITQFLPTHMSRTRQLVEEGMEWIRRGGWIDLTAGPDVPAVIAEYRETKGVDLSRITVSSDAYGSAPQFDDQGILVKYGVGQCTTLLETLRGLVQNHGLSVEDALRPFTQNPATIAALPGKGHLAVGGDSDVLVFAAEDSQFVLEAVFTSRLGRVVV